MKPEEFGTQSPIPFFFRIVYLSNNYRDPLLRTIERDYGLTRPEFSILICLHMRDGLSAIDICGITAQPQNTVGRGVALLLEKSMITKTADAEDGRRYYLHLTKKGERAYQSFIGILEEANARMIACLTERETEQLNALLNKMCAAVVPQ